MKWLTNCCRSIEFTLEASYDRTKSQRATCSDFKLLVLI
jgi:hypothetical protein